MALGKLLDENKMVFRVSVGEATDDDGNVFELNQTMNGALLIRMPSGRTVLWDWNSLIHEAIEIEKEASQNLEEVRPLETEK